MTTISRAQHERHPFSKLLDGAWFLFGDMLHVKINSALAYRFVPSAVMEFKDELVVPCTAEIIYDEASLDEASK